MQGRYIGRTDLPLCEHGAEEIIRLREKYDYPEADAVFTSPLARCTETARLIYPDREAEWRSDFIECDFGEFENKTADELAKNPDFLAWLSGESPAPPAGESAQELLTRAVRGLQTLFTDMMEEKITSAALITHGGIISALVSGLGLPKLQPEQCAVGNGCGFTVLLSPQLWMRERAFEVYGIVPYGMNEAELREQREAR